MAYNTGNAVGSTDARDLYDNAVNLDTAVNSMSARWTDRLGISRPSWSGMVQYADIGPYAAGIEITGYNEIFLHEGEYYRAAASTTLPYTTTGSWSDDGVYFVSVGDAVLRQELETIADTVIGPYRNAVNCNQYGGLQSALADSDTIGKIIIVTDDQTITSSIETAGRKLAVEFGGLITVNSGQTLTINGPFTCGLYQCFDGAGTVTFGSGAVSEVYPEWWGAKADCDDLGVGTDSSYAFQSAINSSSVNMSGFNVGTRVRLSAGTYLLTSGLTSTLYLCFEGSSRFSTELRYLPTAVGATTMITCVGFNARHLHINGTPIDTTYIFRPVTVVDGVITVGDTAISTTELRVDDCKFSGFKTVINLTGGFYHQVRGSHFNYFGIGFDCLETNNFQVSNSKFNKFDIGMQYASGSGPIVFDQCSFEEWTTYLVYGENASNYAELVLSQSYFECGGAGATAGRGLSKSEFTGAFGVVGMLAGTFIGNSISLNGMESFAAGAGADIQSLVSVGNRINYFSGSTSSCRAVYRFNGKSILTGLFNDAGFNVGIEAGGSYTTLYIDSTATTVGVAVESGTDPITKTLLVGKKTFTATTIGMVDPETTATVTYVRRGDVVTVDLPLFSGTSDATTFKLTGFPANIRPSADRSVVVRIRDNGGARVFSLGAVSADGTMTIYSTPAGGAFTASGTKTLEPGTFTYIV